MRRSVVHRPLVRLSPHASRRGRTAPSLPRKPRSLLGTIVAYVLVGAFIGVLGWKLAEAAAETRRLEGFQRPDVAATPPSTPPTTVADGQLAAVLQRHVPTAGTVGLYVKNLTTGAEAQVNGDRAFPAASLYKLPILAEVERQVKLKRLTLDQQITVGRQHWVPGSGVLQARVGDSLPVGELLRLMIVESDNIAAMMLLDLTGLENVNQSMRSMGLRATRLLDFRAPGAYGGPGPYTTTATDMGLLLEVVASGQLVDGDGSEDALRLLEKKQAKEWLGEGLPWWVKVAHKWGDVPGARHDAGVIFTPRGQWVIVVMTEGLDVNGSGAYIRDVSRAVFNYFDGSR